MGSFSGKRASPSRRNGGRTNRRDKLPYQTWAVNNVLRAGVRESKHARYEDYWEKHPPGPMHEPDRPYGVRNGRAICSVCGAENRPGKFDEETGRCLTTCLPDVEEEMTLAAHTKKDIILDALHRNGMAPDVRTLVIWTKGMDHGMNVKTMTKALWAMQKQQLVGFAERHGELFKIRMTDVAAATLYGREKRRKEPVERVVEARKPTIIPAVEYKVPEPPRYAAPPPPAQNTKSFTDEGHATQKQKSASSPQVMGKDVVVDTHTQYQPEVQHNLYPDKPNSRAGMITQRVAARFLDGLDKVGGRNTRRAAARAVGINVNSRPTTLSQAAEHWGWVERVDGNMVQLTDVGRDILRQYREHEGEKIGGGAEKRGRPQMNGVEAMEVVARDVADAEPKPEEVKAAGRIMAGAPNLDQFPLIKELMGKEERMNRYVQAAELLQDDPEGADLILTLLEKLQITDLEREVIRFVRTIQG